MTASQAPCHFCGCPVCACLDKMFCRQEGEPGHNWCGVCEDHGTPRFRCGCTTYLKPQEKRWSGQERKVLIAGRGYVR